MKQFNIILLLILSAFLSNAQHLTISTSGETGSSGTNWSIVGNTLQIATSGTATIHPDVVVNHLTNTGDLVVDLPYVNTLRNIYINNSISYTGSIARTLTVKSATDIVVATGVSITSSAASLNLVLRAAVNTGQRGVVTLNAPVITTNGGHFWAGGGNTDITWNSLTVGNSSARTWTFNEIGLSLIGGTISSNGGNIEMKGHSYYSGTTMGTNHGLFIDNSSISSGSGSIKIEGTLNGKFNNGNSCYIESTTGAVSISSTSGQINIIGNGSDIAGTASGWRVGAHLIGSNFPLTINSISGAIILEGYSAFNNNTLNDVEGLTLFSSGTDRLKITSQSGAITLRGTNTTENLGQYSNSIRFRAPNFVNAIRIGYDGTTTYTGNILIEGNSIYQRDNNAGSGSISIQSTGSLTIQPTSASFSYLRSGNSGALTFDDDWNFGTTLSSFSYGKSTTTSDISFSNALTVAGAITFNVGTMTINSSLTSSASSGTGIELNALKLIHNAGFSVLSQGGNIKYNVINSPVTAGNDYGINFLGNLASSLKAIINANGGNIDILSSFSNSGVNGGSDRAIIVNYTDVLTANSGTINIVGDATNNINTSTCWGFQFINTLIKTNSGSITISGTGGKATPNSRGIAVDASVLRVLSQTGDIIISDLKPVGLTGTYNGGYYNTPTTSDMFIGADGTNVVSSSSNIILKGDRNTFLTSTSGGKQFKCTTSGNVIVESIGTTFDGIDLSGLKILGTPAMVRLGKTTNTANITVSNSIATSGNISIYGGDIAINQNLTTTANNAAILIKASGQIITNDSRTFQTNNGDFVLWSDTDNSNGGLIWLGLNNILNTANGNTSSGLSGGGKIVLAGGLDNGVNGGVANDGVPDGFAANSINNGVNLGSNNTSNYTQMYSGGGDIIVRGSSTLNSSLNTGTGLWSSGRWLANSGKGLIQINGASTNYFGINFSDPASNVTTGNKHIEFISDKSTGNAIEISGSSNSNYGVVFNYDNPKELLATGGGTISITGTGGGVYHGVFIQNTDFLASSGDIIINGGANGIRVASSGSRIGSRPSTSITSSSSNIKWITNSIDFYTLSSGFTNSFSTSGTVTIEPFGNSFSSAISFPNTNIILANTISGYIFGKTTNTANVNIASATSIAGPITIYGGTIAINQNISSSLNSDILLSANALTFATGKTVSSSGNLFLQPQSAATTIGIAGATGTLQLPATYFSTNFADGFNSIHIGSGLQTGAISMNGFTLQDNIHFQTSGNLVLDGLPILGNNSVTLNSGIATITGTPINYFKTTGNGKVIRTLANASTFEFPIGNSSYNPLSITNNTGASDDFSANVMDGLYVNGVSGTAISSTAVNRTWDISKTNANAGSGVDFVFNWNAGEVTNGSFYLPEMNHFSGSAWEVPVVSSSTVGTNSLTVVGYIGTFSPFSIQEGSGLPIELTSFNANCTEIGTTINWQTASEHNSATFDVEKSRDGINWSVVETTAAAGNSTTLLDYTVVDSEQTAGVVYYRLNQIDLDGASKIYGPISANCFETTDFTATVFPNPASGIVTLEMNAPKAQIVSIQICGTDGKAIEQIAKTIEEGTTQIPLSIESLKAGVYTVKVNGENATKTIKLIVL